MKYEENEKKKRKKESWMKYEENERKERKKRKSTE